MPQTAVPEVKKKSKKGVKVKTEPGEEEVQETLNPKERRQAEGKHRVRAELMKRNLVGLSSKSGGGRAHLVGGHMRGGAAAGALMEFFGSTFEPELVNECLPMVKSTLSRTFHLIRTTLADRVATFSELVLWRLTHRTLEEAMNDIGAVFEGEDQDGTWKELEQRRQKMQLEESKLNEDLQLLRKSIEESHLFRLQHGHKSARPKKLD